VTGIVTDSAQAVAPGVKITIRNDLFDSRAFFDDRRLGFQNQA
jgi:hypothetical protein